MTEDIEAAPETEVIPLDKLVAIHAKIKAKQAQLDKSWLSLKSSAKKFASQSKTR